MKKVFVILFLSISLLLSANELLYLWKVQYICEEKINANEDLNYYEILSALQTHCACWMFGWIVEPNTAMICFNKQFFVHWFSPILDFEDDNVIANAKQKLLKGEVEEIKLVWKNYSYKPSILLNGSTIFILNQDGNDYWYYEIPANYKSGRINICGIIISETVFDYLENIGLLYVYTEIASQKINK